MFYYQYYFPQFVPVEYYGQPLYMDRQQPNVQELLQTISSEHRNLYRDLENAGMNRQVIDYVFFFMVNYVVNQANTNQNANQIYSQFQRQVPWFNLIFRQLNVSQSVADRVLRRLIQIVLDLIKGGGDQPGPGPGQGWSNWEDLGGVLTSAPTVASWQPNRLDVFVRGTDNALYHKWWDGSRWLDWESLGGVLTSPPGAVSWGPNRIDVFARGTDNTLFHKWWDGSRWNDWESLGGVLTSGPAVSSRRTNQLDVFVRGTGNRLYMRSWNGSRWLDWEDLGGQIESMSLLEARTII